MDKFHIKETAWCPGCGNFNILGALNETLNDLAIEPHEVLLVGGIGQAAKLPQYINANSFCGLHGRALPAAVGAKIANDNLKVIVNTGDGDSYGEGGNHFIHNIRRNVDITHFVHNNQIYGLTKGQASPTTDIGHITKVQTVGNQNIPMNAVALSIILGAGFVARAFTGEKDHLKMIMSEAIRHKGYSIVDILQPCFSFNKVNTFKWYKDRIYKIDDKFNSNNKLLAIEKSLEWGDNIPIGIIYKEEKPSFNEKFKYLSGKETLINKKYNISLIKEYINEFK